MFLGNLSSANEHETRKKKGGKKVSTSAEYPPTSSFSYNFVDTIHRKLKMMSRSKRGLSFPTFGD